MAANWAWTDDPELREDFTVVMGTMGPLISGLGAWAVRETRRPVGDPAEFSRTPAPRIGILPAERSGAGLGLRETF